VNFFKNICLKGVPAFIFATADETDASANMEFDFADFLNRADEGQASNGGTQDSSFSFFKSF
jgi:hypothetical protein